MYVLEDYFWPHHCSLTRHCSKPKRVIYKYIIYSECAMSASQIIRDTMDSPRMDFNTLKMCNY